jgi:hypothetical protein
MTVRAPEALAETIETARDGSGLSINDFIVGMLQLATDAGLYPSASSEDQDRLPLSA